MSVDMQTPAGHANTDGQAGAEQLQLPELEQLVARGVDAQAASDAIVAEFMRGFDLASSGRALEPEASSHAKRGYVDCITVAMRSPVRLTLRRLFTEGLERGEA